jgi:hypothetical protein
MQKILVAALGIFVLTACNNTVNGTFTNVADTAPVQLVDKSGKTVSLASGNASVKIAGNGQTLTINALTSTGKNDTIVLKGVALPQDDQTATHDFLPADTNQPVDIYEANTVTYDTSPTYDGFQSCSQSIVVYEPCPPPPKPQPVTPPGKPDPGKPDPVKPAPGNPFNGRPPAPPAKPLAFFKAGKTSRKLAEEGCPVTRIVEGHQHIQFNYSGTGYQVELTMRTPGTTTEVGTFLGYAYNSQRNIINWGPCILDR